MEHQILGISLILSLNILIPCQGNLTAIDWSLFDVPEEDAQFLINIQALYNELFISREYRNDLSPVFGTSKQNRSHDPVPKYNVLVLLQYIQLLGIDAQSQLASSSIEIEYKFFDPRLVWNISDYGGVESINIRANNLWQPSNGMSNAKTLQVVYPDIFNTGMIYANGTVVTSFQYYVESRCVIDVREFPFDEQICTLDFFNNAYDYDYVKQTGGLFTKYDEATIFDNGEWTFVNISMLYSITNVNLPKYDFEEQLSKLSIGLTSMMSMTIFVEMLSNEIPRNTTFPLLGWFVIIDVILVSIACVVLVTLPFEKQQSTKNLESGGLRNWLVFLRDWYFSRHFFIFFAFQLANVVNFIVFMSYCFCFIHCKANLTSIDWSLVDVTEVNGEFILNVQKLHKELFIARDYRSELSPVFSASKRNGSANPVPKYNVLVLLQYIQLLGVDAQSQLASSTLEIEYKYFDPRLVWNTSDYGDVESINIRANFLWQPSNGISNAKTFEVVYPDSFNTGMIYANGTVVTSFQYYVESRCVIDVRDFPFDEQICTLDFFNNAYNLDYVRQTGALFTKYDEAVIFDNGEWTFTNFSILYSVPNVRLPKYDFVETQGEFVKNAEKLYTELFTTRNYRNDLSPVFGAPELNLTDNPVPKFDVLISLQYVQLLEINAQSQIISTTMEIEYMYTDPRLVWNTSDFGGVSSINVRSSNLWQPSNGILNAKTMQVVYQDTFNTGMIYANGSVITSYEYYVESSCVIDVRIFPFDEQMCPLDFWNNAYNFNFVRQTGALFTKYDQGTTYDNGEWAFTNVTVTYMITNHNLPKFDLLSIGLTSMMSMTIFVQMLSDEIPRNATFPLLGWFVIIDVILVSIACVVLVTSWLIFLQNWIFSRHFFIFFAFQLAGLVNFIVFMSYWT
ncbi:unnamed protein product, partial [Mesorhabditis spiculigera]